MNHTCTECHCEIVPGHAVLRTVNFERLAFHRECWAFRLLPAQRRPADESVS
jgi:hypothetical protein